MDLDYEPPCEVCGHWPENCICPECEVCGEKGDPRCYDELMGHGLEQSAAQKVERQRYRVKCALEAYREELQILDYLLDRILSQENLNDQMGKSSTRSSKKT